VEGLSIPNVSQSIIVDLKHECIKTSPVKPLDQNFTYYLGSSD